MDALRFLPISPLRAAALGRADVACFVGYVRPRCGPTGFRRRWRAAREAGRLAALEERAGWLEEAPLDLLERRDLDAAAARALLELALPRQVVDDFERTGWLSGGRVQPRYRRSLSDLAFLRDVPVAVESWSAFDELFEPAHSGHTGAARLPAAVRSFFAAGGRRAWIVTVSPLGICPADVRSKDERIAELLPGFPGALSPRGADPGSWRGVGHLLGLDEVSFLAMPDLVEIVADVPEREEYAFGGQQERFVPCGEQPADARMEPLLRGARAPRCDEAGLALWARAVHRATAFLRERRREVQLVAAVPLLGPGAGATADGERILDRWLEQRLDAAPDGIASAFLQLVQPWVRTRGAAALPEGLEGGEGVLLGALARSALGRGCWRSLTGTTLPTVIDVERPPTLAELALSEPARPGGLPRRRTRRERVVLVHRTPRGWSLASDVTTSLDEPHRPAGVARLIAAVVRAARIEGTADSFEPNGEALWTRIRDRFQGLLQQFVEEGALHGTPPYTVRCDRRTTTQGDLDSGRVVVELELRPTVGIERIDVRLALQESAGIRGLEVLA